MSRTDSRRILGTATLAFALLAAAGVQPAAAQTDTAARSGASTAPDNDEGFDMGLLGLAGLLGLRRREAVVTRVDRVDTTASTRPRV